MKKITFSDWHNYSENNGVVGCVECDSDVWCWYPTDGDEIECDCGCEMVFVIEDE